MATITIIMIWSTYVGIVNSQNWSSWYGGGGGNYDFTFEASETYAYINKICVREAAEIDGIQAFFSDGTESDYAGGGGGTWDCYTTNSGQCFTAVSVRYGARVDALQFTTSDGQLTPAWGGTGGSEASVSTGSNACFNKIGVESDARVDRIRFDYITTPNPTGSPTPAPTKMPTKSPTPSPTNYPSKDPTNDPTNDPTSDPTNDPTIDPTSDPTNDPTSDPTNQPTFQPTFDPTFEPTNEPTFDPTNEPTMEPTLDPTEETLSPSVTPSISPTTPSPTINANKQSTPSPTNRLDEGIDEMTTQQPNGVTPAKASTESRSNEDRLMTIIYILTGCLVLLLILFFLFMCKRKKSKENNSNVAVRVLSNEPGVVHIAVDSGVGVEMGNVVAPNTNTNTIVTAGELQNTIPKKNTQMNAAQSEGMYANVPDATPIGDDENVNGAFDHDGGHTMNDDNILPDDAFNDDDDDEESEDDNMDLYQNSNRQKSKGFIGDDVNSVKSN